MDVKTKKKVEETVLEILRGSDMESVTEYKVRAAAADRLGIDLSVPDRKLFVRGVVESYLRSLPYEEEEQQQDGAGEEGKDKQEEEEEEDEEEEEEEKGDRKREYDDLGDLILCRLSTKRRVTLSEFKGRTLVSIREFYLKDGKEMPTSKGISMTVEQWEAFRNAVPAIEDAIKKVGEASD
ncbi:RNA polymerase II transcriptional coactivator KELP [Phragmites australis]|uniref:RNA polymerase II transcriptional coactivator KELP n=1 Tax=Phragmites australis TaxID=29695 RepID=UPI002D7870DF|nr:RNA polymerase II transcriptional coactivator KELP [Phragmites australis]